MKHFLKPLGYCLTTAVMTSAMLRVYAMPAVGATTPEVDPQPSSDTATAERSAAPAAANLSVSAPVALPEVIDYVESAPVPEPAAEPVAELANEPINQPVAEPADALTEAPEPVAKTKPDSPAPQSVEPSTGQSVGQPTAKPEADSSPNLASEAEPSEAEPSEAEPDAKQEPPSTQKADTDSSRTIAGMRQIVEKRLETIASQDKEIRDAKWQQNLIQVALEYAWHGKFDAARKVAANPALPLELQISLLGKIAAIETQFLASQVAPSAEARVNQPRANQSGQSATPQGRNVPSGYSTVSGLAALPGYAGSFDKQCPVIESPPSQSISRTQTRATAAPKRTTGVPDFVPALGQNLASRLARLSQTQSALSPAKAAPQPGLPTQKLISPQLFVGVASSSVQAQPKASQPKASQPKASQPKASQPEPILVGSAQINDPQMSERQFENRLFPAQPQIFAPKALAQGSTANDTARPEIKNINPELQATLPLGDALKPFSFAVPGFFDNSLDWVWNWWNIPTPPAQAEQFSTNLPSRAESPIASASALPFAAELGLTNKLLFQTLEQDWATVSPVFRNARKLSISLPLPKNVSLKAPLKAPVYDPRTLLAISCSRAQLAQSNLSQALIDPATAKQFGWVNFRFPLPIPAVITSAFGWRTHPISGDLRFHTGLDIGAPMGTPVLSAANGRVVVADAMGGYGLAVVVEDESTHQRNLYAHLSGIAVQPGVTVEQGTVLGWVGSTGNSTGPHLHFESQVKTENGWTVIDPLASAAVAVAQGPQE